MTSLELHPKHDESLTDDLESIRGGWIVQRNSEYVVDIVYMLFNWRIHVAYADSYGTSYVHGYCYFGLGDDTLARALTAARKWSDPLRTHPVGFDKQAF